MTATKIGERIQQHLEKLGKLPSWLAENAGTERSTISRVLKGERHPTPETLSNIALALGVPIEQLVAGTDAEDRVQEANKLISREHYEAAVHKVIEFEHKANQLSIRLGELGDEVKKERERRKKAENDLDIAEQKRDEAKRVAANHERDAQRYKDALEKAVGDLASLQTQVQELADTADASRKNIKVAAILAGVAAVASVANYLSTEKKAKQTKTKTAGTKKTRKNK